MCEFKHLFYNEKGTPFLKKDVPENFRLFIYLTDSVITIVSL